MVSISLYSVCAVVIQLITESFPISSSGHVLLFKKLFFKQCMASMVDMPSIVSHYHSCTASYVGLAHGVTGLAIMVFYRNYWLYMLFHIRRLYPIIIRTACYFFVANSVTSLLFLVTRLAVIPQSWISSGFLITGIALLSLRWCSSSRATVSVNMYRITVLGMAQGIAFFPGISRLALVFVTARWLGFSAKKSFEVSWTLYMPLLAAGVLLSAWELSNAPWCIDITTITMLIFVTVSCISYGLFCLSARLAARGLFWCFAVYIIIPLFFSLM